MDNLKLIAGNLIIRSYRKDDYRGLYDTLNDKKVLAFIPEEPITECEAKKAVNWLISNYKLDSDYKYSFVIESKTNQDYMGWCGFGYLDYDKSQVEIYITLKSKYWGQGYATEALDMLLKFIFEKMCLNEITAVVKPDNIASKKVIEKLGFQYDSIITNLPVEYDFYEGELHYLMSKNDYLKKALF